MTYPEEQSPSSSPGGWTSGSRHRRHVVLRPRLPLRAAAVAPGSAGGCCLVSWATTDPLARTVITPPVPELGAEYWVIVHRDLRRAACVRAVIDWIRRVFDEHRDELAGRDGGADDTPRRGIGARSPADKFRPALLAEGRDAFGVVGGHVQLRLHQALDLE